MGRNRESTKAAHAPASSTVRGKRRIGNRMAAQPLKASRVSRVWQLVGVPALMRNQTTGISEREPFGEGLTEARSRARGGEGMTAGRPRVKFR